MQSITSFFLFILEIQSISESSDQTNHTRFWLRPSKNVLINFYVNCINMHKIRLFYWFVLEIWLSKNFCNLRTFWPISQERTFPKIWDLCRKTANNISFHFNTNSEQLMTKSLGKLKKPCFWPILGPFSQILRENLALTHNFIWVSSITPKFRKNQ